jgi:hypothetical protein
MSGIFVWPARLFSFVFLLFVCWQFYIFFRESPRSFTHAETRAAQRVAAMIVAELQHKVEGPTRFGVAHFSGDHYEVVTDSVRAGLSVQPAWSIEEGSIIVRFLEDIARAIGRATSVEEIIQAGQKVELDIIVAGRLVRAETVNDTGIVEVETHIYDVRSGEWLVRSSFTGTWEVGAAERATHRISEVRPFWRFVGWLLFVLMLPWATAFATHYALERRSNIASFTVITGYTVVGMAVALLLIGFSLTGGLSWLSFLIAFLFTAGYNYWACEKIAERDGRS